MPLQCLSVCFLLNIIFTVHLYCVDRLYANVYRKLCLKMLLGFRFRLEHVSSQKSCISNFYLDLDAHFTLLFFCTKTSLHANKRDYYSVIISHSNDEHMQECFSFRLTFAHFCYGRFLSGRIVDIIITSLFSFNAV